MKNDEINEKVKSLISKILNLEKLSDDASQQNTDQWDSLAYLSIVAKIESEFNIKVSAKNIENFGSVKKIVREIKLKK